MVYVDRTGAPTITLRTSDDGGRTWPATTELVLYADLPQSQTWKNGAMQDAWAEMGKFSVGLPATALTREGDLLVVYYAGLETDVTAIHWVRVGKLGSRVGGRCCGYECREEDEFERFPWPLA